MSNVLVEKNKLDILANAISNKSGEPLKLTLDEMVEAVDGIDTSGITPTGNIDITQVGVTDVTNYATATVNEISPLKVELDIQRSYITQSGKRYWEVNPYFQNTGDDGAMVSGYAMYTGNITTFNAIPTGTTVTPTESAQTIGGRNYMMEGSITVNAIPSNYVGSGITRCTASDVVFVEDGEYYAVVGEGYYANNVWKEVPSGTAGTPTATKGTVSNNSITVTPSVTNTTGYITGSTITGTAVTVSASELVSGTLPVTQNGIADVTNYASVNVNVPSSGEDVPVFTIDLTSNPPTTTCNKTFAECEAYIANNKMIAIAYAPAASMTLSMTVYNYVENSMIYYAVYNPAGYPFADITWAINNQPVYYEPSNLKGNLPTNATSYSTGAIQATIASSTSTQYLNIPSGYYPQDKYYKLSAMPSGTLGTPRATKGTVSNHSVSVTPSVTNTTGYVTGGTVNGTAVTVSASELVSGTLNVTSAGTKDVTNYASASILSGTEGTPTATKGTVSNHSVSVTPSVTNTSGFISGSTKSGTAVTVSASELVSGSETKTENGTYDVTNLAELVVDVQGGGSSVQVESVWASSVSSSSLVFSNLKGNPTSFVICIDGGSLTPSATAKTDAIVFDGTSLHGQTIVSGTNAVVYDNTSFSKSYSNGTLTITSTGTAFDTDNGYIVAYSYGGSASNIGTKDVQVGSGATSITFTGLTHEPLYWSCIFKSNFGTSSGYQRVIFVQKVGSIVYGHCMDSATRESSSYWTASYSGGNLTITSQGTNAGGYFHQPGYYQLTYAVDESAPSYQTKTVTPTTSQQVVTADSGYDALSQVTVNAIPNTYVQPTATKGATTYTPGTTNQTIASGTYLTGTQTIAGDADLVGGNILSTANIFGVQGTVVVQNYYTGSSAPSSSTGSNGDLYLQS